MTMPTWTVTLRMLRAPIFGRLCAPFLLGLALSGHLAGISLPVVSALVALALVWLSAVSWNDLADTGADPINLADDPGRPLARGETSRVAVRTQARLATVAAIAVAATGGWPVAAVITATVLLGAAYSLQPLHLGRRVTTAYPTLGLAYGTAPFLLAVVAAGATPNPRDWAAAGLLGMMFAGRMLLKDLRDVRGDRAIGKHTFVLRFGVAATCATAATLIVTAAIALSQVLPGGTAGMSAALVYAGGCCVYSASLARAAGWRAQQLRIVLLVRLSAAYFLVISLVTAAAAGSIPVAVAVLVAVAAVTSAAATHRAALPALNMRRAPVHPLPAHPLLAAIPV